MLEDIVQGLIDIVADALELLTDVLPASPFNYLTEISLDSDLLAFIAWLVPFPQMISLLETWVVAIALYYLYMVFMRWLKLIG